MTKNMHTQPKSLALLGAAWGYGARDRGCAQGAHALQDEHCLEQLSLLKNHNRWHAMIESDVLLQKNSTDPFDRIALLCQQLGKYTEELCKQKKSFLTIGGDHTCAIGTWSGAALAMQNKGPIGMIWFDAHMDAHTPKTTLSGAIHGMPVACLLGYGDPRLTQLLTPTPKLQANHLSLIGVHSFEKGEAQLLHDLNVRVFFIDEVRLRGLASVVAEAKEIATQGTVGYGISIDLDAIDPHDAPGVGSPEPDGLNSQELIDALKIIHNDSKLIGAEIAEYNPYRDIEHRTSKLICQLAKALFD
jgi:arginase